MRIIGFRTLSRVIRKYSKSTNNRADNNNYQNHINSCLSGFSEETYLRNNPDVKAAVCKGEFTSGRDHFIQFGYEEVCSGKRNLNPIEQADLPSDSQPEHLHTVIARFIDQDIYLAENPDIIAGITNGVIKSALDHFSVIGCREITSGTRQSPKTSESLSELLRKVPTEISDTFGYISTCEGFISSDFCRHNLGLPIDSPLLPVMYFLSQKKQGGYPRISTYFDPDYYLLSNHDVRNAGIDPLRHFLYTGIYERRNPHPLIDISYISVLLQTEDRKLQTIVNHIHSNKPVSPYFDVEYYLNEYPDIKDSGIPAIKHFILNGGAELRKPNKWFDYNLYAKHSTLAGYDGLSLLIHFAQEGDRKRIKFSHDFDYDHYLSQTNGQLPGDTPPFLHYVTIGANLGCTPSNKKVIETVKLVSPESYSKINAALGQCMQFMQPINIVTLNDAEAEQTLINLSFRPTDSPKVSIFIPVYNAFTQLVECLRSIAHSVNLEYEVILVNDASTDERISNLISKCNGITFLEHTQNKGFLQTVNCNLGNCTGEYILLLNSDVQLIEDTASVLCKILDTEPDVAIAGPKIVYPSGFLQEAGSSITHTGRVEMIGLNGNAYDPLYSFDRDVDYISGACLLFRNDFRNGSKLFSDDYTPAYAEDLDLCTRLRRDGKKIRYSAQTTIAHHLSVSSDCLGRHYKLFQSANNKKKFLNKHWSFLRGDTRIKTIAFYLPQFHTFRENDLWWGKGFTEWTSTASAKPQFHGHYQPHIPSDLGFYNLLDKATFEAQASMARRYGIFGFCFYYYNFGDRELLSGALDTFVDSNADIEFCLCWANENWTRSWDGRNRDILIAQESNNDDIFLNTLKSIERYINDPRYITIDDRPLILIYRETLFDNIIEKTVAWRNYWRDKYDTDLYLCCVDSMERAAGKSLPPNILGFDAAVEFSAHGVTSRYTLHDTEVMPESTFEGVVINYDDAVIEQCKKEHPGYKRFPCVFPSWDNTPRRGKKAHVFHNSNPSAFLAFLEWKAKEALIYSGDERMLFINAWNEWGEGAHLEPDIEFQTSWLEAVSRVTMGL